MLVNGRAAALPVRAAPLRPDPGAAQVEGQRVLTVSTGFR